MVWYGMVELRLCQLFYKTFFYIHVQSIEKEDLVMTKVLFNASVSNTQSLLYSEKTADRQNDLKQAVVKGSSQKSGDEYVKRTSEPTEADNVNVQNERKNHQKQLDDIEKAKRANTIQTETVINPNNSQKLTIVTKYDSMGNEESITATREDGSVASIANCKDGKQISFDGWFPDGTIAFKAEFVNGKMSKMIDYSSNGNVKKTETYEYYPNGELKSETSDDGMELKTVTYHENGQLKQCKTSNSLGDFIDDYNEEGLLIKKTDPYGDENGIWTYEYNEDGNEIKQCHYSLDGKQLLERAETEYIDNKKITKFYDKDGSLETTSEYEKMPDGSTIYRRNGEFESRIKLVEGDNYEETEEKETYIMNEAGETIAVVKPTIDGSVEFYDGKGNKITEREYNEIIGIPD